MRHLEEILAEVQSYIDTGMSPYQAMSAVLEDSDWDLVLKTLIESVK